MDKSICIEVGSHIKECCNIPYKVVSYPAIDTHSCYMDLSNMDVEIREVMARLSDILATRKVNSITIN